MLTILRCETLGMPHHGEPGDLDIEFLLPTERGLGDDDEPASPVRHRGRAIGVLAAIAAGVLATALLWDDDEAVTGVTTTTVATSPPVRLDPAPSGF